MIRSGFKKPIVIGYAWMSIAVLIWASWLVLTSSGRITALTVFDLAGFRALVPTIFLAPLLWKQRREVARLGILKCLLLFAYGAPFTLCVAYGLQFAPVAHAGATVPGLMPVFATVLSYVFLDQKLTCRQLASTLLILSGAMAILLQSSTVSGEGELWVGHLFFLLGSFCWACFAVTMKAHDISPYLATAIVGSISTAVLVPFWAQPELSRLTSAHVADVAFQAVFQGVISGLIALFAFGQALRLAGAQVTAVSALTPGVATILAIPVLGQIPDRADILVLVVVVAGLVIGTSKTSKISGKNPTFKRNPRLPTCSSHLRDRSLH
ncbi:EamA-like transporter family protein [Roseovarius litorisediminis]|uniref:EamA-like transporter family protein n=1 Tax=Roseovarius litorisediminis TaxID=1312363 RepID=A0A1Y5SER7_9RHOB|nr:DMT family transporter [Roseovarius litorisediminis]SLN38962.1 EamA-like transporter family protein [Roseovarius litorisediminis]